MSAALGEPNGVPAATDACDYADLRAMAVELEQTLELVQSHDGRAVLLDLLAAYRAAIDGYEVTAACGPLRAS